MVNQVHWTNHALERVIQRGLMPEEVERLIRQEHANRALNHGEADWRLYGVRPDGSGFAVIYDHPVLGNRTVARIVSAWVLRDRVQR